MPQVPDYKLPQVEARPITPAYTQGRGVTPDAFGASVGQGLQQLGKGLGDVSETTGRIALQRSAEDNERASKDLDNEYASRVRERMYGPNGFYSKKGENALAESATIEQDLEKIRQEVLGKAPNRRVKEMFDAASRTRTNSILEQSAAHVMNQRDIANKSTSDIRIKEAIDDASVSWNNPKILGQSTAIIQSEVEAQAEMYGWSPEVTASKTQSAITEMYSQAIKSAIKSQQPEQARALFEKAKTYIDGPERADLEKALSEGSLLGKTQAQVDAIIASTGDYTEQMNKARQISDPRERAAAEDMIMERASRTAQLYNIERTLSTVERLADTQRQSDLIMALPGGAEAKLQAARAIEDPELRSAVTQEVGLRISQSATLERAEQARVTSAAAQAVNNGVSLKDWIAENPEDWMVLSGDINAVENLKQAEIAVANGKLFADSTDGTTLSTFQRMDPADLARVDPETVRYKLTQQEYGRLNNLVAGAQATVQRVNENFAIYERGEAVLRDMAPQSLNWGRADQKKSENEMQKNVLNQMNSFITAYTKEGKLPTMPEIEAEAARLMTPVNTYANSSVPWVGGIIDWWSGEQKRLTFDANKFTPSERANLRVSYDEILPAAREKIESEFRSRGIEPTQDKIEQYFGAQLVKDYNRQKELLGVKPGDVTESYVRKTSKVESGNDPNARAATSTAAGLFQFTEKTWLDSVMQMNPELAKGKDKQELLMLRFDPKESEKMFRALSAQSGTILERAGIPTTDANMYLTHFLGASAAPKLIRANDMATVDSVLSPAQIKANPFLKGKTVGWVKNWAKRKMAD